jgi:squalene-hopene/tetraprenyl-beta-curcumene cyclase
MDTRNGIVHLRSACALAFGVLVGAGASLAQAPAPGTSGAPAPSTPAPARPPARSSAQRQRGEDIASSAIEFLRSQQDAATGGWSVPSEPGRPHLPAISSLVLTGMLMQPGLDHTDKDIARGAAYVLSFARDDGGIYDSMLPVYNTAISISMLTRLSTPEARARIAPGVEFLKRSQWGAPEPAGVAGSNKETPAVVGPDNPNFGGLGYGNRGRPDLSNLAFSVQAWHDAGLPKDDPAFARAITFLQRIQMLEKLPNGTPVNDMPYAKGSSQGGFIYATGENEQTTGQGNSWAGTIEETLSDGTKASRLRAYGSVTYSGFKTYIYAGLTPTDPRVLAAVDWTRNNYTLAENPGLGTDGYYYYIALFGRAMKALGRDSIEVTRFAPYRSTIWVSGLRQGTAATDLQSAFSAHGKVAGVTLITSPRTGEPTGNAFVQFAAEDEARKASAAMNGAMVAGVPITTSMTNSPDVPQVRSWRADLIDQLAMMQNADGSFRSVDDRWMENNPSLITAYALLSLQEALRDSAPQPGAAKD